MTIIDDFLTLQKKYTAQYGKKTIVIMEVGSFYEMYGIREDDIVKEIAQLLNIALTRRDKKIKEINTKNPYMIGFTSISISKYLRVLLNHNYTVVRIDQVTPPPNPKRKVVKIYSPSTSLDEYDMKDTNYMLCLFIETINEKMCIGMTLIDLTTGNSIVYEVYDSKNKTDRYVALQEAYRFIYTFHPKEIVIYAEDCKMTKDDLINYLELDTIIHHFYDKYDHTFGKISYQNEFLGKIYEKCGLLTPIQFLDLEKYEFIRKSFVLLLQFAYEHDANIIKHINKPKIYEKQSHLILSNNSIQQLNLLRYDNMESSNKFHSLFDIVNNCCTVIGKRILKEQLLNPILDKEELEQRYNQIEELRENDLYLSFVSELKSICDIERTQRKLTLGILNPFEFYLLDSSYDSVKQLMRLCKSTKYLNYNLDEIHDYTKYYNDIFDIDEMNKYALKDIQGSFFKKGIYPEIDKLQGKINTQKDTLQKLATHFSNLIEKDSNFAKLDKTEKEGYYISLTAKRFEILSKKFTDEITINNTVFPKDCLKVKKLNSAVKITSTEFTKISNAILTDIEKMRVVMKNAYQETCHKIHLKFSLLMKKISITVGELDMFVSNTKTSLLYNYCKPDIIESSENKSSIDALDLRHPITEHLCSQTEYVTNDIKLGYDIDGMIITGLNGVGKSVLIKMIATSVIMAQCGMYVPAKTYKYSPYNHIMSRIGNTDNILKGQSTFVKEMMELSSILKRSNSNTLVIADELCSGSEYMSAQAILASTIITLSKIGATFLFTTHLHGIIEVLKKKKLGNIDFYYLDVEYNEETNDITYHRKLTKGCSDMLYGIEVSKYIIHDNEFIGLANSIRTELLEDSKYIVNPKASSYNSNVYVDECAICKKKFTKSNMDVHHIKFQCEADEHDFIDHRHKNDKSNLVVLCTDHHTMVHNNSITIRGWKESIEKGKYLDYEEHNLKKEKKKKLKYNEEQIKQVKLIKNDFLTPKLASELLKTKYQMKIGVATIKKIWNDTYGN
tara:strand:- start:1667 stop:4702 length:3036 start_codon:yes stop_codon:yes gene_type:complete